MRKKLIFTNILVLFVALVSVLLTSSLITYKKDYALYSHRAKDYLSFTSSFFTGENVAATREAIKDMNSDVRLTILTLSGEVVLDTSGEDLSGNQLTRPCLQSANLGKVFVRESNATQKLMMYVAGLDNNHYLIIALPFTSVATKINNLILWGVVAFLVISTVSSVLLILVHNQSLSSVNKVTHGIGELIGSDAPLISDADEVPHVLNELSTKITHKINEINTKNEELMMVFDTLKQGVALINKLGRLMLVNERLKEIFDFKRHVINRHYVNIVRNVELQKLIEQGLSDRIASKYLYYEDGKAIKCIITPVDMSWLSSGLIVTFEDVTIEHNVDKTKKDFFQNASHELKSPLTSIIGYQQMITEGIATDLKTIKDYSFKTLSEASRMKNILLDMLDLANLEQDYVRVEEKVRVDLLIRDIIESMEERMNAKDIGLQLELDQTELSTDEKLIDELVRNLIDNAIKYNKDGGSIKVSLKNNKFVVSDTGIGIAEEDKHRVFERFYRVDKGRSKARGGTGLGLAIVKHICELYGYDITLASHVGKGTTITIDFKPRQK